MKVLLALSFIKENEGAEGEDGGSDDERVLYNSLAMSKPLNITQRNRNILFNSQVLEFRQYRITPRDLEKRKDYNSRYHSMKRYQRIGNKHSS